MFYVVSSNFESSLLKNIQKEYIVLCHSSSEVLDTSFMSLHLKPKENIVLCHSFFEYTALLILEMHCFMYFFQCFKLAIAIIVEVKIHDF